MTAATIPTITEDEFKAQVMRLLRLCGWRAMHMRPARTALGWRTAVQGEGAGWPDIFAVRGTRALAVELKVGRNVPTPDQEAWLDALGRAGVETAVWRPTDWARIEKTLE